MENIRRRKKIYPDDKAIFSYYQGVLSITNDFLINKGVEQLKIAMKYPDVLKNNFVNLDEVEALLKKEYQKKKEVSDYISSFQMLIQNIQK